MTTDGKFPGLLGEPWRRAYGPASRRAFWSSVLAVPRALGAAVRAVRGGRPGNLVTALVALPVALASSALTAVLAFLVLINVLAYPWREQLVGSGPTDGGYAESWGGPTLAGAWATHAGLTLALVVPVVAWAVRGLTAVQRRLTDALPDRAEAGAAPSPQVDAGAAHRAGARPPHRAGTEALPAGRTPVTAVGTGWHRLVTVIGAVALFVALSLTAHTAGIGDNLLWAPRDLTSGVALAVTLAPLAALPVLARTAWWRRPH
ncbi:hypothetical protein [Micromonospora coxensis]|uniref:Uncharacterized protein n=1 Tax=Micromonospora coxensis TaxID=356852 RepID=A0A1C5IVL1_9ACTN|nr:hypothetical protein [Micromonospora coxensis]SCG62051.1 hypothetical protein GA0070614_3438 [Micromonospora coxensis]